MSIQAHLLAAHPEWRGRIWIFKESVTVRGIGNVPRDDPASVLLYLEDIIEREYGGK